MYLQLTSWTVFGEGITTCPGPVFATQRNAGEDPRTTRADLAIHVFPRINLGLWWDGGVSAAKVANGDASGRSLTEALLVLLRMFVLPVQVQAGWSKAKFPAGGAW